MLKKKNRKGFTLIELLLVIAIIGILAAAILVSISGQREKARRASAMDSARSIMPYVVDCFMRNQAVTLTAGAAICAGNPAAIVTPNISATGCTWPGALGAGATSFTITCAGATNIVCNHGGDGSCQ